jgi:histone H3/H4
MEHASISHFIQPALKRMARDMGAERVSDGFTVRIATVAHAYLHSITRNACNYMQAYKRKTLREQDVVIAANQEDAISKLPKTKCNVNITQDCFYFSKTPFERVVRTMCRSIEPSARVSTEAFLALRALIEQFCITIVTNCVLTAHHAGRKTVTEADAELVLRMRQ